MGGMPWGAHSPAGVHWHCTSGDMAVGIQPPPPPLGPSQTPGHSVPARAGQGKGSAPVCPSPTHWTAGLAPGSPTHGGVGGGVRWPAVPWGALWGTPHPTVGAGTWEGWSRLPSPRHPTVAPRFERALGQQDWGFGARGAAGSTHRVAGEAGAGERAVGAAAGLCRRGAGGGGREKLIIQEAEPRREAKESSSRPRQPRAGRAGRVLASHGHGHGQGHAVQPDAHPSRCAHTHPDVHASARGAGVPGRGAGASPSPSCPCPAPG